MKKTYCLVSAQYLPTMGGVENYTFNLAKELTKNGHKCIIVTSSLPGLNSSEIDDNSIEILRLDSFNFLNNRFPFIKPTRSNMLALKKILSYENLRFIINTRIYPLSLYTSLFAKKNKIPSIIIEHGSFYLSLNNKFFDFIIKLYEHIIIKFIKSNCDNFYGVSKASCDWLSTFKIKAKGTVHNAINIQKIENIPIDKFDLSLYNIPVEAKLVTYIGRFIPEKGVDKLLTAFNELNLDNTYLLYAGEGYLESFLVESKNKNTEIIGKLNYENVISLFKQADIFCLPTVSEGFPTTVLEACACECYTITTMQSGGATELICSSEYGTLIPNNDVEHIKKALFDALNDNSLKEKAKNAKNRVLENYTWETTAKKIETIL